MKKHRTYQTASFRVCPPSDMVAAARVLTMMLRSRPHASDVDPHDLLGRKWAGPELDSLQLI